jgi:cAMP-dependent protein kinase regulator
MRGSNPPFESLGHRVSEPPVNHALNLLLIDEPEDALRWAAAVLERDPWSATAIVVTSRVLGQMGRLAAAADGLHLAVRRAIDAGDLPLAVVAVDQLRSLGVDVGPSLDAIAAGFCEGSQRSQVGPVPHDMDDAFQPLSPLLSGESLAAKAAQILLAAKHAERDAGTDLAAATPLPLFGALPRQALREFIEVLETTFAAAGQRLLQEGKDSGAAYIVASGHLEISRRSGEAAGRSRTVLSRVGGGALVGEVALMSSLPCAASVTAITGSILLVARRSAVDLVAARHPELSLELAAFCRRHAVANLGLDSSLVAAVPSHERAGLVEKLETRTFERGEKLVAHGEEAQGLHLIVSGEVAIVARDGTDRIMLATRVAGDTVGEVETVLCQRANVDAIALRSTAALLLSPEKFFDLVRESPATLHGLYAVAVRRYAELRRALEDGASVVSSPWVLDAISREYLLRATGALSAEGDANGATRSTPPALPREGTFSSPTPPPVGPYAAATATIPGGIQSPQSVAPPAAALRPSDPSVPSKATPSMTSRFVPGPSVPPSLTSSLPPPPTMNRWTIPIVSVAATASLILLIDTVRERGYVTALRAAAANPAPTAQASAPVRETKDVPDPSPMDAAHAFSSTRPTASAPSTTHVAATPNRVHAAPAAQHALARAEPSTSPTVHIEPTAPSSPTAVATPATSASAPATSPAATTSASTPASTTSSSTAEDEFGGRQ